MSLSMDGDNLFIPDDVIIAFYIVIILACSLSNAAVICIVIVRPGLHTSTSYFFLSLSVADLLVGVVVVSLTLVHKLDIDYLANASRAACIVPPFIELACVTASVYSLLCVSIDRYRSIVLARKPPSDATIVLSFLLVWTWSFLYATRIFVQDYFTDNDGSTDNGSETNATDQLQALTPEYNRTVPDDHDVTDTSFCSIMVEEDDADLPFRLVDILMLFIIPVAAMTYIFVQIRSRLWGSSVGVTTNVRKKRSVIRFLAFDILVFVLCWLPFYMVDIVSDSVKLILGSAGDDEVDENQAYILLRFFFIILALSNSFLNPLIYAFFNKNFINEVRLMFSKSWCGPCALNRVVPVNTDETQASGLPEEPVIITT